MDDRIVPCGNNLSRFLLGLIPGRRDVYLRALEDRESCHIAGKIPPHWVGSGYMAPQGSQRLRSRIELHGNVVRIETRSIESHKGCQRMLSHQIMQDLKTCLFEMGGNIHPLAPGTMTSEWSPEAASNVPARCRRRRQRSLRQEEQQS